MRITFDVSEATHKKLCLIPNGYRKYAYRFLFEAYADYLVSNPAEALHTLMGKHLEMHKLLKGGPLGRPLDRAEEPARSS